MVKNRRHNLAKSIWLLALLQLTVNGAYASELLNYSIKKTVSLPDDCFTQGFLIHKQQFYLSCGRYKKSRLLKTDLSGKLLMQKILPESIFAEGISIIGNKLYLLTWKQQRAYVFDADTLKKINTINYQGQGWGLATHNQLLMMSNGSHQIQVKKPDNFSTLQNLDVTSNSLLSKNINELEQVGNLTIANIWQSNNILFLKKRHNNYLEEVAHLDMTSIKQTIDKSKKQHVLNGIAYDKQTGCLWITGKEWNKAFALSIQTKRVSSLEEIDFSCNQVTEYSIDTEATK